MADSIIPEKLLPVTSATDNSLVRGLNSEGKSVSFNIDGPNGIASSEAMSEALIQINDEFESAISEINETASKMLTASTSPKFHQGGGQLASLNRALTDPAHQAVYITFVGDSITWGATLPENAPSDPRSGTLGDPRDNFESPSFVNEFKRYIGREYFDGANAILSNWSYSPSGQSTTLYQKNIDLYANSHPCVASVSGAGTSISEIESGNFIFGKAVQLNVANGATGSATITIEHFTGTAISLVYATAAGLGCDYEIIVNGVNIGTFSTEGATSYGNVRNHTFGYVRDKTVIIKAKYPDAGTGTKRLIVEGVRIPKRCRITNQGIIGTEFRRYSDWNFGAFGPSVTSENDEYYFVQLGANSRGQTETPTSANRIYGLANTLVGKLEAGDAKVIMMVSNPANPDYPSPPFKFSMGDVRRVVKDYSISSNISFIDNYAAFEGLSISEYTADGLHPNKLGHAIISKNIIGALGMS